VIFALVLVIALLPLSVFAQSAPAQSPRPDPPPQFDETIEVVGATPIHGLGIPRNKIPGNVQTASSGDLTRAGGIHAGEQLTNRLASVHVNDAQNNPFQGDIQFRGFVASPLLGLPQGLAVYQDGVRINEPFGDSVNWDLLPSSAIAGINLMPGSNPLFGLNALGGALSIQTKTGFSDPGHGASVFAGSFGRRWADLHSSGHGERIAYFVTGRLLAEDGWRDFSPSRLRQLFANVEWRAGSTIVNASITGGRNRLIGNGPAPVQLLEEDRRAIFTHPDETKTAATLLSVRGRHATGRDVSVEALAYYRPATIRTLNGDDSTYDGFDATRNTSGTSTRGWGAAVQATMTKSLAGRENHFVAGISVDGARSRYESDTELAQLTADRGTIGAGLFDAGAAVRLRTRTRHAGVYAADFFTVAPRLTLMAAVRVNHTISELRDQIDDDLDGDHLFESVNPSAGLTYELSNGVNVFASFGVSSRVPSPSEVSCADPEDPCRLPNAFVADPPLEQVVARTWEAGARGRRRGISWTASAFRTTNHDDLIFISSGALTNEGHFANVGNTRRQGVEVAASAAAKMLRWSAAYTYLRATFQAPFSLSSVNHPGAIAGEIHVEPGRSIPGVPRHNFKGEVSAAPGRSTIGAAISITSSQLLRGDEANLLPPIAGAATLSAFGGYAIHPRVRLVARITNLLNARYETFGVLGEADDVLGAGYDDPRFLGPGAPRAAWVGLEWSIR
jgi:iron complex outermembrane receptor protein